MFARIVVWLFCLNQLVSLREVKRAFQTGDVMLGGLTVLHYKDANDKCSLGFFPVGLGHAEAMILTIDQINKDPSLLPNVTLGFDIRDYCETVSVAVKETYDFVRDAELHHMYANTNSTINNETASCYSGDPVAPVSTILGPYDSASAIQIASLLSMAKIPIISFAATSDELSSDQFPYFFRTVPPDKQQAKVQADLFEYFKWTYVGTVALDDSYGRFGVSALQKEAYNRGTFCLAFSEFIPRLRAATDMKQIVSRIKQQSSVKVIVVWVFGGYAKLFFEEVHRLKLGRRTWILGDGTSTEDSGLLGPYFRLLDGALGVQPRDRKDETLLNHLYSLTPHKTRLGRNPWWEEYWTKFRSCTFDADSATDPRCFNVPLSYNEVSKLFDPYLGYLIDGIFAVAYALDKHFRCRASDRELPGETCPDVKSSATYGEDLLFHLKNVNFSGLTGVVEFDRDGDPKNSFFEIVNIQINGERISKKVLVGSWNSKNKPRLALNDSAIKWTNASFPTTVPSSFCHEVCPPGTRQEVTTPCCWKCVTCPGGTVSKLPGSTNCTQCPYQQKPNDDKTKCVDLPVKNLHFRDAGGVFLSFVAALGFCVTMAMSLVFVKYRETPIVKASNRQLSFLLLATIFSSFTLALLSIAEPTDSICRLIQFSRYAIYTTFVSILWLKSVRIFVLFQLNSSEMPFQSYIAKVKYQIGLVALVNVVDFLLLIAWFASDPPYRNEKIQPTQFIFYTCKLYGSSVGKAFYFMVCSYVLLLSLLSSFYAFRVRKVPDNFNEARFIGFSLYIILLSALCYYSVEFSVQDGWYVSVIACSTTLVDSFGLLGCMFIPKAFNILFHPERNKKELIGAQVTAYVWQNSQLASASTRDNRPEISQSSESTVVEPKN
ncbi:extracellular calcium-sensing receptor-like [Stylophora pistillata]|uniref:extracellular calcium-sensing receptor-like n=1 Tax=Stylophora pistillata TaxID=50429 RepID=UPI000C04539B|nr:extracellular calcium-sensing receptor-like [Stylophora pistillata]